MNDPLFPLLIDRVVHFRWIESLLVLGQVDRAWRECRHLLESIQIRHLSVEMQALVDQARALDRSSVKISGWDLLTDYLRKCKAADYPVVGVRSEMIWSGFMVDEPNDEPFEPFMQTFVWHRGEKARKALCHRKGFAEIGIDLGGDSGAGREIHVLGYSPRPIGLAPFATDLWRLTKFNRNRGLEGVAFQSSSLAMAIAIHTALREMLLVHGLPMDVPVIFANDHNAPEFTAPVAVQGEYKRDIEGNFCVAPAEPVVALPGPDDLPDPDADPACNERTFMFAQLLAGPRIDEYNELANRRMAGTARFELKKIYFPDYRRTASGGDEARFDFMSLAAEVMAERRNKSTLSPQLQDAMKAWLRTFR